MKGGRRVARVRESVRMLCDSWCRPRRLHRRRMKGRMREARLREGVSMLAGSWRPHRRVRCSLLARRQQKNQPIHAAIAAEHFKALLSSLVCEPSSTAHRLSRSSFRPGLRAVRKVETLLDHVFYHFTQTLGRQCRLCSLWRRNSRWQRQI
jgi:hypothetical protein